MAVLSLHVFFEMGLWVRVQTCKEFCSCWRNCTGLFRSCNRLIKVYCSYVAIKRSSFPALHVAQLHQWLFITGLRGSRTHVHHCMVLALLWCRSGLVTYQQLHKPLSLQSAGASTVKERKTSGTSSCALKTCGSHPDLVN